MTPILASKQKRRRRDCIRKPWGLVHLHGIGTAWKWCLVMLLCDRTQHDQGPFLKVMITFYLVSIWKRLGLEAEIKSVKMVLCKCVFLIIWISEKVHYKPTWHLRILEFERNNISPLKRKNNSLFMYGNVWMWKPVLLSSFKLKRLTSIFINAAIVVWIKHCMRYTQHSQASSSKQQCTYQGGTDGRRLG